MGLHGESETSVRLGDEEDDGSNPAWYNQGESLANTDDGDENSQGLTKRVSTPPRPTGSEADLGSTRTPTKSVAGE